MRQLHFTYRDKEVSNGTLNPDHLLDAFVEFLKGVQKDRQKKVWANFSKERQKFDASCPEFDKRFADIQQDIVCIKESPTDEEAYKAKVLWDDLHVLMNDIAPTGTYFGSNDVSGSCFGYWQTEESKRFVCTYDYSAKRYIGTKFSDKVMEDIGAQEKIPDDMKCLTKRDCIIVDVDGTIAQMTEARHPDPKKRPFAWDKVGTDIPKFDVLWMVHQLVHNNPDLDLIIVTGRDGVCHEETKKWLELVKVDYFDALMQRPINNFEKDSEIKKRIYKELIEPYWNVRCVFDDRNQAVDMWREELGLPCFQVAKGDF